jgi:hypothetical protein
MEIKTDYSLIQFTKEDIYRLQVIGDIYIGKLRFHAINNYIYNDEQELVGIIYENSIVWLTYYKDNI